eukprot:Gb_35533 [translate_table: standard]
MFEFYICYVLLLEIAGYCGVVQRLCCRAYINVTMGLADQWPQLRMAFVGACRTRAATSDGYLSTILYVWFLLYGVKICMCNGSNYYWVYC